MIYLIFTKQGFEEAKTDILREKATLWINADTLTEDQIQELKSQQIQYHLLGDYIDASREPEVLKALQYVEKQTQDRHILVEYI